MQRAVHEQARVGPAGLAGPGEVHARDRSCRGLLEVGVVEDDHRVLATELEGHLLDAALGRGSLDGAPGRFGADEPDPAYGGVAHQPVRDRGTVADDDVDHTGREDQVGELGQPQRRERRRLRGLGHDRVACHERRRHPAGEHQRVVVGEDLRDDADRLPDGQVQVLAGGDRRALHLQREAGVHAHLPPGRSRRRSARWRSVSPRRRCRAAPAPRRAARPGRRTVAPARRAAARGWPARPAEPRRQPRRRDRRRRARRPVLRRPPPG